MLEGVDEGLCSVAGRSLSFSPIHLCDAPPEDTEERLDDCILSNEGCNLIDVMIDVAVGFVVDTDEIVYVVAAGSVVIMIGYQIEWVVNVLVEKVKKTEMKTE
eukprot:CAMPEP_0182426972 /NCGR_PEP_ID=MMETSP1167-20130531/13493_1 /TAXON_ID=2988 /ORGANISM="Mallomonas Sp, Strain CCMP3275" /LENGTH=102 /DNA_ID=CAMNT_0024608765 /DNA_START=821 /DNA_END=1130 /DNA_ORIENTATION=-